MSLYTSNTLRVLKAVAVQNKFTVRTITTTKILQSTLKHSPNARLCKTIIDKYLCLPLPECACLIEYVWIDGTGQNLRSKSRTLNFTPVAYKEVPVWSYDGNATYQAIGKNSDVQLVPVALYKCPFRRGNNKIVLCETFYYTFKPVNSNHRAKCRETLNQVCDHEVMLGFEQDYILMDVDNRPVGWPVMHGDPEHHKGYYSGVGADKVYGRDIIEAHYRACLYAGVLLHGSKAESTLSEWQYQIGVCKGIKGPDDLWIARYIMARIAEEYGLNVSHEPKPFPNWNRCGCHVSFSTKAMRADNGLTAIEAVIEKLKNKHSEQLEPHKHNKCLPDCANKPPHTEEFTYGVGDGSASVKICNDVAAKKKGHFKDQRPPANIDPYKLCDTIIRTCLL